MSKILVTGGTGYIGGRLVSALSNFGHQVKIGTRHPGNAGNDLFVVTDFENAKSLPAAIKDFDSIIHLAGSNEIESVSNPEKALYETAVYTNRLVNAAKEAGTKKFIYFSTVHVYGAPLKGELSEKVPASPKHPYAIAHLCAENFVLMANGKNSLQTAIIRLSNGFGYPEKKEVNRWTLLVNDLCKQAIKKKQLTLNSSGNQLRDFIPISDVCSAVNSLLLTSFCEYPVFNLGSGKSISVYQMAIKIAEVYKTLFNQDLPVYRPTTVDMQLIVEFKLNIDAILSTGYCPENQIDYEIEKTLRMCQQWFTQL